MTESEEFHQIYKLDTVEIRRIGCWARKDAATAFIAAKG